MKSSGIVYRPRACARPETELSALACLYRFVLDCHARKEATRPGSPEAAKETKNDSRHCHRNT
jgi:hypothetical protein